MKQTTYFLFLLFSICYGIQANAQVDKCLRFDGVNDYIRTTSNPELWLTTGTLEAWVKTKFEPGYHGIVVKQIAYGLLVENGIFVTYDWHASANLSSGTYIADQAWHHVAMTFMSGVTNGTKLYVDGVLKLTTTFTVEAPGVPGHPAHEVTIGTGNTNADGQFLNGSIDEVRIWNVVRTEAEIQSKLYTELVGDESGLVSYYRFNQGAPNGNNTGVTTLIGNATLYPNNGALTNFDLSGNSSNWVAVSTALPVELLSFKATPQYEAIKLDWQTAYEANNKGFQIERLKALNNEWEVLAFVNSHEKNPSYEYVDNAYPTSQSAHYYRLRQIDMDGKETLSKVVSVALNAEKTLKIYPSIVTEGVLNIDLAEKNARPEGSDFTIINLLGQQLQHGKTGQQINVSALPRGTYMVKVGLEQAKFVKQ
jgi:Concanavalin A-like lectin/glucanases superfamily/Secretion system C-terminal sorting domain